MRAMRNICAVLVVGALLAGCAGRPGERPAGFSLTEDIAYGPEGTWAKLDLMLPEGQGPFPVVLCIHGGGWRKGRKEQIRRYGRWIAEMGIAAVLPDYRLSRTAPHPAQEEDIFAVLDWIAANREEYSFDVHRIGLTGVSAGGHLTSLVGLKATRREGGSYTVKCIVPVSGPSDLRGVLGGPPDHRGVKRVAELVGGPPHEHVDKVRDASPILHVHPRAPACLAMHGADDAVVPAAQAIALVDSLQAVGVEARAIIVPGAGHTGYMPGSGRREPLGGLAEFQAFFRRHLLAE